GPVAGLLANRLAELRRAVQLGFVEGGDTVGGDHVWSSFDTDIRPLQRSWTGELYAHRWVSGYDVRFPEYNRTLKTGYASARSERLDAVVRERLPQGAVMTGVMAEKVSPTMVGLSDGQMLSAPGVIDCRGQSSSKHLRLGWQKFAGLEIETSQPHGIERPIIMDATVPQLGGYRFVYTLPTGPNALLVEDTYYTEGPDLAADTVFARVHDYIEEADLGEWREVRRETGVLPIALDGDIDAFWDEQPDGLPRAGMAAALFNPITGYSFADAVATADLVKGLKRLDSGPLYAALRDHSVATWKSRKFYRLLNRMMFEAATPETRYRTLQHFYALDEGLVERFYAGQSTRADMARILSGKPPVPVTKALSVLARSVPSIGWRPRWRAKA
ncbi:MAG: lycopene beta-cyclase CrtY, partial [Pacificimonas sp.]